MKSLFTLCLLFFFAQLSLHSNSIDTFKKGLALEPENVELKRSLLEAYSASGYYLDLIALAREMIFLDVDDARTVELLINAYLSRQDYEKASFYFFTYDAMTDGEYPENLFDVIFALGEGLYRGGDYENSQKILEKALSLSPRHPAASYYLGEISVNRGHDDKAVVFFHSAFQGEDDGMKRSAARALVKSYNRLIHFDYYQGDIKSCEASLEKVREPLQYLLNKEKESLSEIGELLAFQAGYAIQKKEWSRAVLPLKSLLEYEPDFPGIEELLQQTAQGLTEENDLSSALEIYGTVLNTMERPLQAVIQISLYYAGLKEWEAAYYYSKTAAEWQSTPENISRHQAIKERYIELLQRDKRKFSEENKGAEAFLAERRQRAAEGVTDEVVSPPASGESHELVRLWTHEKEKKRIQAADVYHRLAEDHFRKGQLGEAYSYLRKGMSLCPESKKSIELYIKLLPLYQVRQERLIRFLEKYMDEGEFSQAAQLLQKEVSLLSDERAEEMREEIESRAATKEKRTARSLINTGRYYLERNNFRRARFYFNRAREYADYNDEALRLIRTAYQRENDVIRKMKDAYLLAKVNDDINAMKTAINDILLIRPGESWARSRAAELGLLEDNIKMEKAESYYLEGIRYYTEGNFRQAIETWEKAEELVPGYKNIVNYLDRAKKRMAL